MQVVFLCVGFVVLTMFSGDFVLQNLLQWSLTHIVLNLFASSYMNLATCPQFWKSSLLLLYICRLNWPNSEKPLLFVDCVNGREETRAEGISWQNRQEALVVVKIVQHLLSNSDISGDIGVIAPYAAQVSISRGLRRDGKVYLLCK